MAKEFQLRQGPFLLAPYNPRGGVYSPEVLVGLYARLKDEGLWDTVFHDNPDMNLLDFMEFFSMPSVMLQFVNILDGENVSDIGAIAWLSGVEQYGSRQRAVANFCVFKSYQRPVLTDPMARLIFGYWFECLGIDVIVGMTPAANAPAVNFIKRVGFVEACRIPNYSFYKGSTTDCVISFMDTKSYSELYGG